MRIPQEEAEFLKLLKKAHLTNHLLLQLPGLPCIFKFTANHRGISLALRGMYGSCTEMHRGFTEIHGGVGNEILLALVVRLTTYIFFLRDMASNFIVFLDKACMLQAGDRT